MSNLFHFFVRTRTSLFYHCYAALRAATEQDNAIFTFFVSVLMARRRGSKNTDKYQRERHTNMRIRQKTQKKDHSTLFMNSQSFEPFAVVRNLITNILIVKTHWVNYAICAISFITIISFPIVITFLKPLQQQQYHSH